MTEMLSICWAWEFRFEDERELNPRTDKGCSICPTCACLSGTTVFFLTCFDCLNSNKYMADIWQIHGQYKPGMNDD